MLLVDRLSHHGHCQTNLNGAAKGADLRRSGGASTHGGHAQHLGCDPVCGCDGLPVAAVAEGFSTGLNRVRPFLPHA